MAISHEDQSRVDELLELGAATVGESGGRTMSSRMRAAWPGARLCAPVVTVRCAPGDNLAIHVAVAKTASVALVASVGEDEEHGYWGEVLTTAAMARGIAGLVIEGGVRDIAALESVGFPAFSTKVALAGTTKSREGEVGAPVEVAGVRVSSGDWVVADSDGVAVIEADRLDEVLVAARARAEKERRMFEELRTGRSTLDLLGLDPSPVRFP